MSKNKLRFLVQKNFKKIFRLFLIKFLIKVWTISGKSKVAW